MSLKLHLQYLLYREERMGIMEGHVLKITLVFSTVQRGEDEIKVLWILVNRGKNENH